MKYLQAIQIIIFVLTPFVNSAQNKKEKIVTLEKINDSLNIQIELRLNELQQNKQSNSEQQQKKHKLESERRNITAELASISKEFEEQHSAVELKKEKTKLLKQIVITENIQNEINRRYNSIPPLINLDYNNEDITILQYDKEHSTLKYLPGNGTDYVQNISNWFLINSEDVEKQKEIIQKACSCHIEIPTLYDMLKIQEFMIPEQITRLGIIRVKEGTLHLNEKCEDNFLNFKKIETEKFKNTSAYVLFIKTIQL